MKKYKNKGVTVIDKIPRIRYLHNSGVEQSLQFSGYLSVSFLKVSIYYFHKNLENFVSLNSLIDLIQISISSCQEEFFLLKEEEKPFS